MREARLILPNVGNDGADLTPVHTTIRRALAERFGGFTAAPVFGGWVSPDGKLYEEAGTAYDAAAPDDTASAEFLRGLARTAGEAARQEAMYLRLPNGEVEIIETAPVRAAAA